MRTLRPPHDLGRLAYVLWLGLLRLRGGEMKRQPDDGLDAVHTRLAIAMQTPETNGPWTIDTILAECPDPECMECGRLICPHHEPLHFHHDGCPACAESSMRCPECDSANVVAGDETTMHCDSCDHIWRDFP